MSAKKSSQHAKHAFFYLVSFMTLALTAFNVGVICFQIINSYFPEEFYGYGNTFSQDLLKFAIATLIISAPVYYFFTRVINRSLSKKNLDQDSGIRKWLTYIVLFIAVGIVIGDLIAALYSFLDGEITIRFFLKVLTILFISGGVFAYYFLDIKNENQEKRNTKNTVWGIVFWAVILVPLVWAIFLMENPTEARDRKIDDQTELHLQQVRSVVDDFYREEKKLPQRIEEITSPQYYLPNMTELQEQNFSYQSLGSTQYELCADFKRDNQGDDRVRRGYYYDQNWEHPAGRQCFTLDAPKF